MITNRMIDSAFRAMRRAADASGYGGWVDDEYCREAGIAVLKQVDVDVGITPGRPRPTPEPAPEPEPVHPDVERETAWHMFERLVAELASKFQSHPGGPPGVRPGG